MRTDISVADLTRILCEPSQNSADALACCAAVRQTAATAVSVAPIATDELRRIYRIRASLPVVGRPERVQETIVRVLLDLEAYEGDVVKMVVLGEAQTISCVILDEDESRLVTCLVLQDRRDLPGVEGRR